MHDRRCPPLTLDRHPPTPTYSPHSSRISHLSATLGARLPLEAQSCAVLSGAIWSAQPGGWSSTGDIGYTRSLASRSIESRVVLVEPAWLWVFLRYEIKNRLRAVKGCIRECVREVNSVGHDRFSSFLSLELSSAQKDHSDICRPRQLTVAGWRQSTDV